MRWIIDNWSLLVAVIALVVVAIYFIKSFYELPSDTQIQKVKEWLLYAVTLAEKELGGGTGQLKLRYVYDIFLSKFPNIAPIVSFETFSLWVDTALEQMKHLVKTNDKVKSYVDGE